MRGIKWLFHEVHRRGLWQAGAAFLGGGWAVLEVMDLFTNRGLLPDWTFMGALVVLGLGFPVVMATAFVQTPVDKGSPKDENPPAARAEERAEAGRERATSPPDAGEGPVYRSLRAFLTWRRAFLGGVLAFGALGLAMAAFGIMRVTGIGAPATLLAQGLIEEGGLVVLADFASTAGSAAPGDLVTEALRIDLEQSPTFELMDPRAVAAGLGRMVRDPDEPFSEELALELAVREGAKAVVSGEVGSIGGGYLLSAQILSARDGGVLAAFRETARDSTRLIDAIDALSGSIRSKMGEALRSVASGDPLVEATTTSLEALRKYTFVAQREPRGALSGLRAREIMEEAVALDTTFAEAYRYLSILINNYGGSVQLGVDAATKAFQYRERLPPRKGLLAEANYHMRVTGDYRQAARAYRGLLELDSLDAVAAVNLADVIMYDGEYEEAEALLLLKPRPETIPWMWNLMVSLAGQEKYEEAEALLQESLATMPDNAYLAPTRALFFATRGRSEEALAELASAGPLLDDVTSWGAYVEGVALAQAGRLDEAREQLARSDALLREYGTPTERIQFGGATPIVSGWLEGDRRRGIRDLEALSSSIPYEEMEPVDRLHGAVALLYALLGDRDGAQSFLERYRTEVPSEGDPMGRADAAVAGALIRILDGATVEASGLEAAANAVRCARCRRLYLGYAYELTGETQEAIDAYEAYVGDGFFDASLVVLHFPAPVVHERLGRLHHALGDSATAAEHYRTFAALWDGADPELRPRVARARDRIAAGSASHDQGDPGSL
jgi:tetratricopeptide (TPR) repeat protein